MAKWTFTTPVPVGELAPQDLTDLELKSFVREGDEITAHWQYGWTDAGEFVATTHKPFNRSATLRVEKYADVRAALDNLERALLRRLGQDGEIPGGSD